MGNNIPTDSLKMASVLATFFQTDVKSFSLQIAEDDGEVDLDFPGILTYTHKIKTKIEFQIEMGLCLAS